MTYINIIKALHIIFVVTWFAGLFYLPRLFIYHVEASEKPEPEKKILITQFKLMQKRLWLGITWPSMLLTVIFGYWCAFNISCWTNSWFIIKLCLVFGLMIYHFSLHQIYGDLKKDIIKYTSNQLRIWNEVATIFLVAIVFLVELKDALNFLWGIIGFILLSGVLFLAIQIYKCIRKNN